MAFLWYYLAYRVFRGDRPYRQTPPGHQTVFGYLFAGTVMFVLFSMGTALFVAEGPVWLMIPFALATLLVVVCTWANIVALRDSRARGQQSKTAGNVL